MFSGGIEKQHRAVMGYYVYNPVYLAIQQAIRCLKL